MTADELRDCIDRIDTTAGSARLALHALEDAPDAPSRVIAFRRLTDALRGVSHDAYTLGRELRVLGVER